jgi:predicted amidohydrolase YtcJ
MAAAMDRFGINPDERLTGTEALALFTSGAARLLREPEPLSVGSPADFVVIDTNPTKATATEVRDARILDTYVDGVPVHVDRSIPVWTS